MASLSRRSQRSTNIWPGFVDALGTLLMVIVFLLMVFVMAQFFLADALSGRESALEDLNSQVSELGELLALERKANDDMRVDLSQVSDELKASVNRRDALNASLLAAIGKSDALGRTAKVDTETIANQTQELASLAQQIEAMRALRDELEKKTAALAGKLDESDSSLIQERRVSESARAQIALLNKQMGALREQLAQLSEALDIAQSKAEKQGVQIQSLGKRLNSALASKVQELSRYRSEFFGRLRKVLGNRAGVRIVGDRFVFQSEVLFASGSANIGRSGQTQMATLAETLKTISNDIPADIDWILRVDGHTDVDPIHTAKFQSNWELSSARAIEVVRLLIKNGIPANRLVAAGFGQYQPIEFRKGEIAKRRNRRIELKLTQR